MRIKLLIPFLLLAASACVAPSSSPPAVQPAPAAPPAAPAPAQPVRPAGEWIDWPLAIGDWSYRRDARGSIAIFGAPGQNAIVTLRCDTQLRRVFLNREGTGGTRMIVRASSSMKEFAASLSGGSSAYIAAEIAPADPILDAIALSRGRFAIEADGTQSIAVPSWAEITRVVEDCRG